jgi:hypothetical protein
VILHLAWFHRDEGHWLGEWRGHVTPPTVPVTVSGDARTLVLSTWLHDLQRLVTAMMLDGQAPGTLEEAWHLAAWRACPPGGAVCLDVTVFAWPVGDQVWNRWSDYDRRLDWGRPHTLVGVDLARPILGGWVHTTRPVQPVAGRAIVDITGTGVEERLLNAAPIREVRQLPEAVEILQSVAAPVTGHVLGVRRRRAP